MSHTRANILMLIASLIWGTAFVSQTTGMGAIGPFTFSFGRFFFAFLTVIPFAIYLEQQNIVKILSDNGVKSFNSLEEKFDPEIHEAISSQEDNKKENGIIKIVFLIIAYPKF